MSSIPVEDCAGDEREPGYSRLRAARRRRLLESAQRTFLRVGYRAATMERVAEDAGVSKQTLYNYFADKEELFASLLEMRHEEHAIAAIEAALNAIPESEPEAALLTAMQALFRYAATPENAGLHRIVIEVLGELPELMAQLRARFFLRYVERVRAALDRGAAAGWLRRVDAEAAAYVMFGAATAFGMFRLPIPDPSLESLTPERMAEAMADLLAHGLVESACQR